MTRRHRKISAKVHLNGNKERFTWTVHQTTDHFMSFTNRITFWKRRCLRTMKMKHPEPRRRRVEDHGKIGVWEPETWSSSTWRTRWLLFPHPNSKMLKMFIATNAAIMTRVARWICCIGVPSREGGKLIRRSNFQLLSLFVNENPRVRPHGASPPARPSARVRTLPTRTDLPYADADPFGMGHISNDFRVSQKFLNEDSGAIQFDSNTFCAPKHVRQPHN